MASSAVASGMTFRKRGRSSSPMGESASGCRNMLFGVKQMSGLRHLRNGCRRSRWKYCAAVEGWHHLHVVARAKLQIALDARAGVLRPLAFMAVRQQQHQPAQQVPLILTGRDELIDDDLRSVGEIAELRLPRDQRLGIVARESVLKSHYRRFRQLRVVDLNPRLSRRKMAQAARIPSRPRYRSAPNAAD